MNHKHPLIIGTFILTITGLISRVIGFFYRIYLAQVFGSEGMGLYQLLFPVLSFSFAISGAGIQTSISKYVAESTSQKSTASPMRLLSSGLLLSCILSLLCSITISTFSTFIATYILLEVRTAPLLKILALSIPLSGVHACINGYFYGLKKTTIPALAQLIEQISRVGCIYLVHLKAINEGITPTISYVIWGLFIGELVSIIFSISAFLIITKTTLLKQLTQILQFHLSSLSSILTMSIPLTLNRIVITILQSIEAIAIPNLLMEYGYDNRTALSIFGILTGMALPLILFPCAITNSLSVLLLPYISEANAIGNSYLIRKVIKKTITYCFLLGFGCMLLFLLFGNLAGTLLFHDELAGKFIITLSFLCPFLYLNTTLSSILHGLGKASLVFFINVCSLSIRLLFVFSMIPIQGVQGYFWGLLISQIFTSIFCIYHLHPTRKKKII